MKYSQIIIVKRWIPILKEYERTKAKVSPRPFRYVKDLCEAHHISKKELCRYYRKWVEGGKTSEVLLPATRGVKPGSRRVPKPIERNIIKAYRRFGSNRYELVLLFKPYYLDKTPSSATMDRIKARYPLNESNRYIILNMRQSCLITVLNLKAYLVKSIHLKRCVMNWGSNTSIRNPITRRLTAR